MSHLRLILCIASILPSINCGMNPPDNDSAGTTNLLQESWGFSGMNVPGDDSHNGDLIPLGVRAVRVGVTAKPTTVSNYKGANMKVLMSMDGNTCTGCDHSSFAQKAGEFAASYGANVDAYEIWNEENNGSSYLSASEYADLLNLTCQSIHNANGSAWVVFGGLVGADNNYVQDVMNAMTGMSPGWNCINAVAYHLYEDANKCSTSCAAMYTAGDLRLVSRICG